MEIEDPNKSGYENLIKKFGTRSFLEYVIFREFQKNHDFSASKTPLRKFGTRILDFPKWGSNKYATVQKKYLLWKNIFDPELSHTYRFPIWGNPKSVSQTFAMAFLKPENHDFSEIHEK